MEQPPIELFGIKIQEPVTSLTDLLVGVACLIAYYLLKKRNRKERAFVFFRLFFLLTGIGTILGGLLGHAFVYVADSIWLKTPGWLVSMVGITLIERGCIEHARPLISNKLVNFFKVLNILELLVFMFLSFFYLEFMYVQIHSTYGLVVVVFSYELYVYYKTRDKSILYMLGAVASMVVCATVYIAELRIHIYFNHADLAHVFMLISTILAYKAIQGITLKTVREKAENV